jgi:hypothetical protein
MKRPIPRRQLVLALAVVGAVLAWFGSAFAESPERYPYDPACPWGRLADGHGMLIRCLGPAEASALLQAPAPQAAATKDLATKDKDRETKPAGEGKSSDSTRGQKLAVTGLGPVQADSGELPLAEKKLGLAKDRYIECVQMHGGLTKNKGKVVVRFLVRERGRAEGVSVKSVDGMSEQAGKCIADVVDRRYVGYPAAPIVGATIPIELSTQ